MKRSTLLALGAFAALAVAWLATREPTVAVGVHKLSLAPLSADAVTKVIISGPAPLTLEQQADGGWTVSATGARRFAANDALVKGFTRALAEVRDPDFVSDRADRHAELELDDAKGVTVTAATAQGEARALVLGKASKSGGDYVRKPGTNDVFSVRGGLGAMARRSLTEWRSKQVATFKRDELASVVVEPLSSQAFKLERDGASWKLVGDHPSDFAFDPEAAERLVAQLVALTAQDFADGLGDEPAIATIEAHLTTGAKVTLEVFGKRRDGLHVLRRSGDPQLYLLPAWQAEVLSRDREGVRDLRPLHFEVAKVDGVTFGAGASRVAVTRDGTGWKVTSPKTLPAGFDFDARQVDAVVQHLATLRGQALSPLTEAKAGLGKPSVLVELAMKDGAPKRLRLAEAEGKLFAAGDDGRVYAMAMEEKRQLDQGLERFRRPPAPQFNAQGFERLPPEIRAQLEAQLRAQQ